MDLVVGGQKGIRLNEDGTEVDVIFGANNALATNATQGFVQLPSQAGTPTGTPATIKTGKIPMCVDSTNDIIYIYSNGAWTDGVSGIASVVADLSPQLGGNLAVNGNDIDITAGDLITDTTTGTKIATGTTQKIGFWNVTPVVQQSHIADATDAASVILRLNDLLAQMATLGLQAAS